MENLTTILKQHQIESDSLEVLFALAQEKSYVLACEGAVAFSYWQQLRRPCEPHVTPSGYLTIASGLF